MSNDFKAKEVYYLLTAMLFLYCLIWIPLNFIMMNIFPDSIIMAIDGPKPDSYMTSKGAMSIISCIIVGIMIIGKFLLRKNVEHTKIFYIDIALCVIFAIATWVLGIIACF